MIISTLEFDNDTSGSLRLIFLHNFHEYVETGNHVYNIDLMRSM